MKKNIITVFIIISLITGGLLTWSYFASFHNIKFVVKQPNLTINISDKNNTIITSLINSETMLSLQDGSYYYQINDNRFNSTKTAFYINKSTSEIVINPDYSSTYLTNQLVIERDTILKVISNTYPTIISNYNISNGQLFAQGNWFAAAIKRKTQTGDISDPYKIIMNKQNDKWVIIHYPEIVVTKYTSPDVPVNILNSINDLSVN